MVTTLERWPWLPWALQKSASLGQAMFSIVWVGAVITRKGSSPRQVHAQPTFKKAKQGEWDTRRGRRREGRELKRVTMQHFTAG